MTQSVPQNRCENDASASRACKQVVNKKTSEFVSKDEIKRTTYRSFKACTFPAYTFTSSRTRNGRVTAPVDGEKINNSKLDNVCKFETLGR